MNRTHAQTDQLIATINALTESEAGGGAALPNMTAPPGAQFSAVDLRRDDSNDPTVVAPPGARFGAAVARQKQDNQKDPVIVPPPGAQFGATAARQKQDNSNRRKERRSKEKPPTKHAKEVGASANFNDTDKKTGVTFESSNTHERLRALESNREQLNTERDRQNCAADDGRFSNSPYPRHSRDFNADTEGLTDSEGSTDSESSTDTEDSTDTENSTDTEDSTDAGEDTS